MINIQDEKIYIQIVEDYSDTLYRIAYQNLESVHDAEDTVQEVFLKLLKRKFKTYENQEHLKAWLIRVTINQCTDYKRKKLRRNEVDFSTQDYADDNKPISLLSEIMELSIEERNIIFLYYYEGYSIKEIAAILKKNQNTVNSKLTRSRKKLKTILEEEIYEHLQRVNG